MFNFKNLTKKFLVQIYKSLIFFTNYWLVGLLTLLNVSEKCAKKRISYIDFGSILSKNFIDCVSLWPFADTPTV